MAKLRIIGRIEGDCWNVESSEAARIEKILKALHLLSKWTPLDKVAERIDENVASVIFSIRLLFNAERVEKVTPYGTEVIARFPFIHIHKKSRNTTANLKRMKFLRAPIYLKKA